MEHRLKELVTARKLKVRPLAEQMGEDYSEVSRVINGKRNLSLKWLLKFSKALNVSPSEIVDLDLGLPTTCDTVLMGSVISFVFDACKETGVALDAKETAAWISFIYNHTVRHNLSAGQTKDLAFSIVKATQDEAVA